MNGRPNVRIFPTDINHKAPQFGPLLCHDCGDWPAPRMVDNITKAGPRLCERCWQERRDRR
jgi:hypothetical protein